MIQWLYRMHILFHQELVEQVNFVIIDSKKYLFFIFTCHYWIYFWRYVRNDIGTPSTALLNVLPKFVYPNECQHVVSCLNQYKQAITDKLNNLGIVSLNVPLDDDDVLSIQISLACFIQNAGKYPSVIYSDLSHNSN